MKLYSAGTALKKRLTQSYTRGKAGGIVLFCSLTTVQLYFTMTLSHVLIDRHNCNQTRNKMK